MWDEDNSILPFISRVLTPYNQGIFTFNFSAIEKADYEIIFAHADGDIDAGIPSNQIQNEAGEVMIISCVERAAMLGDEIVAALFAAAPPPGMHTGNDPNKTLRTNAIATIITETNDICLQSRCILMQKRNSLPTIRGSKPISGLTHFPRKD